MHKATIVYIAMVGVCGLLLWGILLLGRHLTPPENIGGTWTAEAAGGGPGPMRVEQSGHFFQISFEDGRRADVKLDRQIAEGDGVTMKLAGGPWHFDVSGKPSANTMHWVVNGPETADWIARRSDDHAAAGKGGEK